MTSFIVVLSANLILQLLSEIMHLKTGHQSSFLFYETVLENPIPLIDDKKKDM